MKTRSLFLIPFCVISFLANAQLNQRFDNTIYHALYLSEAAKLIKSDKNLLILDVRSPGEYAETGADLSLNIGRLRGAINISIDSIPNHLKELEPYKNKNILVYCSHSQRSRKVSKFLGDHGFTKVNSLNGGMTLVNKSTDTEFPVKTALYTTKNPYKLIQSKDAYQFIRTPGNVIIDLRAANQFNNIDSAEENNIGRIKRAVNIPAKDLDNKMAWLNKYKTKPVMLYSEDDAESNGAALKLKKAGFKNVSVLFQGLFTLLVNTASTSTLRKELFVNVPKYKIIGSKEAIDLVKGNQHLIIADLRPQSQFENKSKTTFLNLGHIQNAVNLPTETQLTDYLKGRPKSTPILVYSSGMASMPGMEKSLNASKVCKQLSAEGYINVYLASEGLYQIVWAVTNVENARNGYSVFTDHKDLY